MNFFDAINSHVAWKVHLQHHLLGIAAAVFDAHGAGEDNRCELGRWLYDNLTTWQEQPAYWDVMREHTAFYHCAGEIVRLHGAGRTAEAEHLLHHGYAAHSHRLVQMLRALSRLIDDAGT